MKGKIIAIIVASSFLVVGGVVAGVGFAVANGVYSTFDGYESITYDLTSEQTNSITSIKLEVRASNVIINHSTDDMIHFVYDKIPFIKSTISVNESGDTLSFDTKWQSENLFDYVWWHPTEYASFEISIPENLSFNLELDLNACNVQFEKPFTNCEDKTLFVDANASTLIFKNQNFRSVSMDIDATTSVLSNFVNEHESSVLKINADASDIKYENIKYTEVIEDFDATNSVCSDNSFLFASKYDAKIDSGNITMYLDSPESLVGNIKCNASRMTLILKGSKEDYNFTLDNHATRVNGEYLTTNTSASKVISIKANASTITIKYF